MISSIDGARSLQLRAFTVFGALAYTLSLVWSLKVMISPLWSYQGFKWAPSTDNLVILAALIFAVLPSCLLRIRGQVPSDIVMWILYLLVYIPSVTLPTFAFGTRENQLLQLSSALAVSFFLVVIVANLPSKRIRRLRFEESKYWKALAIIALAGNVWVFIEYGAPTRLPDFREVYDVRADFVDATAGVSFIGYLTLSWMQKVVNPLLIGYGLARGKLLSVIGGILGQLFLYGITGNKSVLLSGLMILFIVLALRYRGKFFGIFLIWGAGAMVLIAAWVDTIINTFWYSSLLVRRLILTPGLLTWYYFDFFSDNEKGAQFGPFFRGLFEYPYDAGIPFLIGAHFYGDPSTSANANFWADGYANFGYAGMFVQSILVGLMLWLFNSMSIGRDRLICLVLAAAGGWSLVNSSLYAVLITHGLLFALVLLFLLPPAPRREVSGPADHLENAHRIGSNHFLSS
jgi:oligosaccharide repeat unit polymerase